MNFLTLQLGVAFSLLVLIGNCGQTYAAPKPCKGGCSETTGFNSGHTANIPAVLGHSDATEMDGVHSGYKSANLLGLNNILEILLSYIINASSG